MGSYYSLYWLPLVVLTCCCCITFHSFHASAQIQIPFAIYPKNSSCLGYGHEEVLQSKNGRFALKFSKLSNQNQYLVIGYIEHNEITVWAANRNRPIRGNPCLKLGPQGDLILQHPNGSLAWSSNVSQIDHLELQDSGNLILQNSKNETLWASFDQPTDTIIQGGYLGSGKALISNKFSNDLSEGPYMLKMEPGGVVLYGSFPASLPYGVWTYNPLGVGSSSFTTFALHSACNNTLLQYGSRGEGISLEQINGTVSAECVNETQGQTSSSRQIIIGDPVGNDFFRFLRLDPDGNVRTYTQSETRLIADLDMFSVYFQDVCMLPDICGSLGICSSGGICKCQDDLIFKEFQSNIGCIPRKSPICGASNQFLKLEGVDYFANGYTNPGFSNLEQCKSSCFSDCSCAAAFFWNNSRACYHYQEVKSLRRVSDQSILAFIKVGPGSFKEIADKSKTKRNLILAIAVAGAFIVIIVSSLLGFFIWRYKNKKSMKSKSEEDEFLENLPGLPPRFSYKQMEEATDGFSKQLGAGGFGAVFEGKLPDGRKVAVKKLGSADQGHLQFRAEVAALGSISHVNLVRLFGFCADGTHRLLVYEYMSNVSLDRWLFKRPVDRSSVLDWEKRNKIIHDTAQGLAFLHEKSRDRILHLDVKPQNILLDENFRAKLADFGLAKLMDRSQSRAFTRIRGTPGYLAPEWLLNASATDRSDVYSFGMVLLEIISGRKNFDLSEPEELQFFPCWAINMIEEGKFMEVVDPKLGDLADYEWEQTERAIKIAFWCIQENAHARPSMNQVVLMLEGHMKVDNPPLSVLFLSIARARISAYSSEFEGPPTEATSSNIATFSTTLSGR